LNRNNSILHQNYNWLTVKAETVNAWYDPSSNFITIPIGITRYPMFRSDYSYDLAFLGSVIGHELGHATDSSGRYFDENGSYLITQNVSYIDENEINDRMKCMVKDYGKMCGNEEYGHHTLGEDMADQFGLRMILAITNYNLINYDISDNTTDSIIDKIKMINNSAQSKEFILQKKMVHRDLFINFARVWCGRSTYNQECNNAVNDVHALSKHRVVKTLRQFASFKNAFECHDKDPMVNKNVCLIY
jgi:predicted metalloendopeptidase